MRDLLQALSAPAVVADSESGCPKPDRRICDHAAGAAGQEPAELLFVANHPGDDVAGGRAAGRWSIWHNPEGELLPPHVEPPDHTMHTLTELLALPVVLLLRSFVVTPVGKTPVLRLGIEDRR